MSNPLAKLDKATQWLAEAKTLDELKHIVDIADAARVYAQAEKEDSLNNARAMMGWDRPVEIERSPDLRDYRIELPNLYDDAGLDPFEFRLLAHYVRVGSCTEGTRTTSKKCGMSPMSVSEKRKALHDKGLILLTIIPLVKGFSYRVSVVDKWQENFLKYSPRTPGVHPRTPQRVKELQEEAVASQQTSPNLFRLYEQEIGVLTPMIADALEDAEKTYPLKWITDAFSEAVKNNKRNWKYCEAILKRWKAQGHQEPSKKEASTPPNKRTFPKFIDGRLVME